MILQQSKGLVKRKPVVPQEINAQVLKIQSDQELIIRVGL